MDYYYHTFIWNLSHNYFMLLGFKEEFSVKTHMSSASQF